MNYELLNERSKQTHINNAKWWTDLTTGESILETRNRPELMMLIVTELTEANQGHLDQAMDDKLPHRAQEEVEIADAAIRLHDVCAAEQINLTEAVWDEVNQYMIEYERKFIVATASEPQLTDFLMAIVDLVSEAMEGYRKRTAPEMLARYRNGLAKALIACYYVADEWELDIEGAIEEKQAFNKVRPDHQIENRLKEGGKSC